METPPLSDARGAALRTAESRRSVFLWALVVLCLAFVVGTIFLCIWLGPLLFQEARQVEKYPEYAATQALIRKNIQGQPRPGMSVTEVGKKVYSPLVYEEFHVNAFVPEDAAGTPALSWRLVNSRMRVRFDRLAGSISLLLSLVVLSGFLVRTLRRGAVSGAPPSSVGGNSPVDAEGLLVEELARLDDNYAHYDSRAAVLLVLTSLGVLAGLGVFYYFLPLPFEDFGLSDEKKMNALGLTKLFLLAAYVQSTAFLLAKLHRQAVGDSETVIRQRQILLRLLTATWLAKKPTVSMNEEKVIDALLREGSFQKQAGDLGAGAERDGSESNVLHQLEKAISDLRKHLLGDSGQGKSS